MPIIDYKAPFKSDIDAAPTGLGDVLGLGFYNDAAPDGALTCARCRCKNW